jgi:flagellar hook assembly protein FlgD
VPTDFSLSHNFPNPFNPTTTLSVTVPMASDVRIDIYSTLGHRVRTLFVGLLEAGRHWFSWDGRNDAGEATPSGAYYCRLCAPSGRSFVTKMILIR